MVKEARQETDVPQSIHLIAHHVRHLNTPPYTPAPLANPLLLCPPYQESMYSLCGCAYRGRVPVAACVIALTTWMGSWLVSSDRPIATIDDCKHHAYHTQLILYYTMHHRQIHSERRLPRSLPLPFLPPLPLTSRKSVPYSCCLCGGSLAYVSRIDWVMPATRGVLWKPGFTTHTYTNRHDTHRHT